MLLACERNKIDIDNVLSRTNLGGDPRSSRPLGAFRPGALHFVVGGLSFETNTDHEQNHNGSDLCPHCEAYCWSVRRIWRGWDDGRRNELFEMDQLHRHLPAVGVRRVRLLGRIYERGLSSVTTLPIVSVE